MGMQMSTPIGNQLTGRKKKHSDYQGKDWAHIKNKSKHYRTKSKNKKESDELVPRVSPTYANEGTYDGEWSSDSDVEDYVENGEIDAIARARVTIDQTVENTTTDGNTGDNNQYERADDENYAITCTYEDHIYSPMVWTQPCQPSSVGYGSSTEGLENAEEDRLSGHSATEGDRRSTASQDVVPRPEYSLDNFGYYNQVPRVSPTDADEGTYDEARANDSDAEDYAENGEIDAIARARAMMDQTVENTTTDGNTDDNNQYERADEENDAITYDDHIYSLMVWPPPCQPSSVDYGSSTLGLENAEEDRLSAQSASEGDRRSTASQDAVSRSEYILDDFGYYNQNAEEDRLSAHSATEGDRRSTASQDVVPKSECSLDDFGYYNQHSHQKAINNQQVKTKRRNSHEETTGRSEEATSDMNYINDPVKLGSYLPKVPRPAVRSATDELPVIGKFSYDSPASRPPFGTSVGRDLAKLQLNAENFVVVPFFIETSVGEFCAMMSEDYGGRARIIDTDESEFNKRIMLKKLTAPFIIEFDGYRTNSYSLRLCNSESDHQGPSRKEMAVDGHLLTLMMFCVSNNNPTVTQFKATFCKLIGNRVAESDAGKTGNVTAQDKILMIQATPEVDQFLEPTMISDVKISVIHNALSKDQEVSNDINCSLILKANKTSAKPSEVEIHLVAAVPGSGSSWSISSIQAITDRA
ncbi:uncharacterized protein [Watersipora subatra]|uniref:uncharacterized protein n=1 Tax=Watersipora subatra TaxID=2589382 RepID=UPI00355B30F3